MEENFALLYVYGMKMTVSNLCEMIEGIIVNKDLFIDMNLKLRLLFDLNETINAYNFRDMRLNNKKALETIRE
jgi:hypothetical protein